MYLDISKKSKQLIILNGGSNKQSNSKILLVWSLEDVHRDTMGVLSLAGMSYMCVYTCVFTLSK